MLAALLDWIAQSDVARWMKGARTVYPVVNAAHILAFALLFGAIATFDAAILLKLGTPDARRALAAVLPNAAALGLLLAVPLGLLLFSVEPHRYAANPAFRLKLVLVVAGTVHAFAARQNRAFRTLAATGEVGPEARVVALVSLLVWIAAIGAGRMIAFL